MPVSKAGSNCCLPPLKAPQGDKEAKQEVTVCLAAAKGLSTEAAGVIILMKTGIFTFKEDQINHERLFLGEKTLSTGFGVYIETLLQIAPGHS